VFDCGVGITRRVEHFVQALVDVTADLGAADREATHRLAPKAGCTFGLKTQRRSAHAEPSIQIRWPADPKDGHGHGDRPGWSASCSTRPGRDRDLAV